MDELIEGATYTLDARTPDGAYASDSGLTAQQVRNAYANATRLGIAILAVVRDDEPVMSPQEMENAFRLS